jgi:Bacterial SH3 domain
VNNADSLNCFLLACESARQFAQGYVDASTAAVPQDDLHAAPSAAPLPGFSIETVEQHPGKPAQTRATEESRIAVITVPVKQELHVRSEHNSRSTMVTSLHQGDRVFLEEERYQNDDPPLPITWQKARTMKGQTGWVNAEYLSRD